MSKALTVAPKAHASLGASAAHRWMECPGSIRMSEGIPNKESEHSKVGTAAHALAELCLRNGTEPGAYVGTEIEHVEVSEEMAEAVQVFVDFCRELLRRASAHGIEQRISLAALNPPGPMYGTSDFWAYTPDDKTLHVPDYKNGSGVVVEAKGNKQLRYYALGVALSLPATLVVERVKMYIVQPNAFHPEGVVREDEISYVDLLDFSGELFTAARRTQDPNAPLSAGPHCRWCPAAAICPEKKRIAEETALVEFDAMPVDLPPAPETLPVEVLADIASKLPILDDWIKSVRAHCAHLLSTGEATSEQLGMKFVEKRAKREWVNPAEAEEFFREAKGLTTEEIFELKIKSPAKMEKVLHSKKAIPPDFTVKRSSGVTLVPVTDKRPEKLLDPGSEFTAIESGTDEE